MLPSARRTSGRFPQRRSEACTVEAGADQGTPPIHCQHQAVSVGDDRELSRGVDRLPLEPQVHDAMGFLVDRVASYSAEGA